MPTNTNAIAASVADEVRAHMARRRISQAQLVKSLPGLTQSALSRRLRGEIPFDVEELGRLAAFFDINVSAFLRAPDEAAS